MKYWLSHLPLEVWVDVFRYPWISREEMGRIVDRIGNYKFAEYLQFYLHDWGKHKLNELFYDKDGFYKKFRLYMDFPLAPMPDNIKFFKVISIKHFNAQTLAFLRQIQAILSDVDLHLFHIFPNNLEQLRTILANLVPLLRGIHALSCNVIALPTVKQCFGEKMSKLKQLEIFHFEDEPMDGALLQTTFNFVMDWLTSPQQDKNEPRLCRARIHNDNALLPQIYQAIREEFLVAKTPSTFALIIRCVDFDYPAWQQLAEFHLQNNIGEELHCAKTHQHEHVRHIRFTRHPANCATEKEFRKWIAKEHNWESDGQIWISKPTIGLLDS